MHLFGHILDHDYYFELPMRRRHHRKAGESSRPNKVDANIFAAVVFM
jgi:hypothetical protein